MSKSLAELRANPPRGYREEAVTACLNQHLIAEVQSLGNELSSLASTALADGPDDAEQDGPPSRLAGHKRDPRVAEIRDRMAELLREIADEEGEFRLRDDPDAQARFLGIMAEQSERMRRLIEGLLGLSRIELAEHQAPTERVDLAALARREAEAMAPILAARDVRLAPELEEGATAAPADAEQLAQVVRNLLENAVRHGREGGTVRLCVARTGSPRPGILLSVTDDGPGIAREHIPRLTERFYRIDKARNRRDGGTGLGLAIVKHIVNRHRGQLLIESQEGEGATFKVWLPAE